EVETLDSVAAAAPAVPAPAAPASVPAAANAQATLVIKVTEDCWAEVKDAGGNRLAYGVLKANSETAVSGRPPFSLTLGNAQAVSITLNGKPVAEELYKPKRGTVSRFQLNLPAQ
ncbi:MAG TPA: DUF4115 domain-containing protein, partial [Candidatus Competibacteraceae bacterium]|nr:DUF4115 domain-containing protein [Candidatus Competibacteraceae bacterium]